MALNQFAKISPIVNSDGYLLVQDKNGDYTKVNDKLIRLKENECGICIDDNSLVVMFKGQVRKLGSGSTITTTLNIDKENLSISDKITSYMNKYLLNSIDIILENSISDDKYIIMILYDNNGNSEEVYLLPEMNNKSTRCLINKEFEGELFIKLIDNSGNDVTSYEGDHIRLIMTYISNI